MWNVCFDSLLRLFDQSPVRCIGFADDGALVTQGSDPAQLVAHMQHAIDLALDWGQRSGLTFSPTKTSAMVFTRKTKRSPFPPLHMAGVDISYVPTAKYLGLLLDSRLSWHANLSWKIKTAKFLLL